MEERIKTQVIINQGLKRQFKACCDENALTLYAALEEALNDWLAKKAEEAWKR